jgi:hypothetical protein
MKKNYRPEIPMVRTGKEEKKESNLIFLLLGFTRGHRIRSSLPFIIKPPTNTSKSHSLGILLL